MNIKKLIFGTIIGGIVYFLLGWLVFGILLKDLISVPPEYSNILIPDEEFKISLMFISCLVWGLLLSFIFHQWANITSFIGGLKAGAIIGFLVSLSTGLGVASMYKFGNVSNVIIESLASALTTALVGGAIGWYFGRK